MVVDIVAPPPPLSLTEQLSGESLFSLVKKRILGCTKQEGERGGGEARL